MSCWRICTEDVYASVGILMSMLNHSSRFIMSSIGQRRKYAHEICTGSQRKMAEGRKMDCRGGVTAGNDRYLYCIFACKRRPSNIAATLI